MVMAERQHLYKGTLTIEPDTDADNEITATASPNRI